MSLLFPEELADLEDQLLDDFDLLTDLYDKKFKHLDTHEDIGMKGVMKGG